MHNITIIFSHHSDIGNCNSDELYKIFLSIIPEVIFEERPPNYFINTLETKSIKMYLKINNVEIIPVDIYIKPRNEVTYMFSQFIIHDKEYSEIFDEQESLIELKGFDYLNSDNFFDLFEKKKIREKQLIDANAFFKEELLRIYYLHLEDINTRDNAMLQNIYNYSKENPFNQAVFLIGAGHRKSIIQKINDFDKTSEIKLNWSTLSLH